MSTRTTQGNCNISHIYALPNVSIVTEHTQKLKHQEGFASMDCEVGTLTERISPFIAAAK